MTLFDLIDRTDLLVWFFILMGLVFLWLPRPNK